jgi:hypothetical protein
MNGVDSIYSGQTSDVLGTKSLIYPMPWGQTSDALGTKSLIYPMPWGQTSDALGTFSATSLYSVKPFFPVTL